MSDVQTNEERSNADSAKCDASNRFGILCPMRNSCSRFTRPTAGSIQKWFIVAPFFGHVDEERARFGCDHYANNGRELSA